MKDKTNPHWGGPGAIVIMNYENPVYPCVMMRAPLPRFEQDYPDLNALGTFIFSMTPHRGSLTYNKARDAVELRFETDEKAKAAARHLLERLSAVNGGEISPISAEITGHQLGGACLGTVCDDKGRVNGHPGLYVIDGALIPGSSTCVNSGPDDRGTRGTLLGSDRRTRYEREIMGRRSERFDSCGSPNCIPRPNANGRLDASAPA